MIRSLRVHILAGEDTCDECPHVINAGLGTRYCSLFATGDSMGSIYAKTLQPLGDSFKRLLECKEAEYETILLETCYAPPKEQHAG